MALLVHAHWSNWSIFSTVDILWLITVPDVAINPDTNVVNNKLLSMGAGGNLRMTR